MPEVKVAIVIANYNTAHFVINAIQSALAQDYPHKGIFIVDDCSTDESVSDIKQNFGFCSCGCHNARLHHGVIHFTDCCKKTYEQFNILVEDNEYYQLFNLSQELPVYLFALKKNVGRGQVRNFPIAWTLNNGYHLVQILDSDDMMYPNKVSSLAKVMLEDPEHIGLVYGDYIILNTETNVSSYESKPTFEYLKLHAQGLSMIHSGSLINGAALNQVGLYRGDLAVAEDLDLYRRITQNFMAINVGYPLTIVRSHNLDSTHAVSKERWQSDFQKAMSGA